jgi:ketosteroid isomerase-like protein
MSQENIEALRGWASAWEARRGGGPLVNRHTGDAVHTSIEFDEPLAILWRFRDGRVIYLRSFRDPDEALEAAALSE